ncbi:hypothetical protein EVJ58_g7408 [Rhodofomes roseus]|uniref:FAD-binding domain-containing protein n=1 Tax=Rhodofomes roseus TaxID=34475 RepID=A0A4Y9Y3Q2_9APHY|nr:hypothetical protein EVJ58_g7408 [Rhodofomes roseus]
MPLEAPLRIRFLVVGGALARVGHEVAVLEKDDGQSNSGHHGIRIPPNMTKILSNWGLKPQLQDVGLVSRILLFSRLENEELLGTQVWDYEVLKEMRGEFLLTTHAELHRILSDAAVAHGVNIRYDAQVVSIDPDLGQVRLASGDTLSADVIIGADGETGISRDVLVGQHDRGTPVGMSVIHATFSTTIATKEMPDAIRQAVDLEDNVIFAGFGNGCGAAAWPIHQRKEVALEFILRDPATEGTWGDAPCTDLSALVPSPCDPRATNAVRTVIKDYSPLESWVHDSARFVVIGQAAHAFPAIAVQAVAMAVEDAAVLGKLFCHLSSRDQISSFLWAFQDIRQKRCATLHQVELGYIWFMTLQDGPHQQARDEGLKERYRAGKNVMSAEDGEEETPQWRDVRATFDYDCEDHADDWWVQWGLLRERAKSPEASQARDLVFTWSNMGVAVDQSTDAKRE